jgi:hypothetical protein
MTCECGMKMKCRFSVPLKFGEGEARYRHYKCGNCLEEAETIEIDKKDLMEGEIKAALERGRKGRFRFYKAKSKG